MIERSSMMSIFRVFLVKYTKSFIVLFVLLVIEGITSAFSLLAMVPMADFLLDATMKNASSISKMVMRLFNSAGWKVNFWTLGGLFVALNLLKGIIDVGIKYAILKVKYSVIRGLVGDTLGTFFKARWEFFSNANNGQLLNTLTKEVSNIGDTLGSIATVFAQIIQVIIYLAVPIWLNASMTFTAIGLVILFAVPFLLLHKVSYKLGQRNNETAGDMMGVLSEVLQAARLILGFGRQEDARKRYVDALDRHTEVTLKSQTLSTVVPVFFKPLAMLAAIIAMGIAIQRQTPVSELAAVMYSLLAAMPIFSTLLQGKMTVSTFLPSYDQLIALGKNAASLEEVEGKIIFSKLENEINLKDIFFSYPGRDETLTNINIKIRKGSMTALVGESGSGKSTLTDIVLGMQIPGKGAVLIDGISLADMKQNSFRKHIGYVPQDSMLFHTSIRNNLLWSVETATEEDLWGALRLANAEKFVKELPQGIDTLVGERGVRLSGGQRQRIALARALLRKPELLILDEATSSLDTESESLIQESINKVAENTTILVVAHRLSTISKANQVYVLRKGLVIEEGPFNDLSVKEGGFLNYMLKTQMPENNMLQG